MSEVPAGQPIEQTQALRPDVIGQKEVQTTVPEGLQIYHPATRAARTLELDLTRIDDVPAGEYVTEFSWQTMRDPDDPDAEIAGVATEHLTVVETRQGKAVLYSESIFGPARVLIEPGLESVYEDLGYPTQEIDGKTYVLGYPTPKTVQRTAEAYGVPVRLLGQGELGDRKPTLDPVNGYISGEVYLKSFSHGEYPVSVVDTTLFMHDIDLGNVHFLGIIAGGAELMHIFQKAATSALSGSIPLEDMVRAIDGMSGSVAAYLRGNREFAEGVAYHFGEILGLSGDEIRAIFERASRRVETVG